MTTDLSSLFPRPAFMDVSPYPSAGRSTSRSAGTGRSTSTASTPLDHLKRSRGEDELDAYLAGPAPKRMEMTPCHTPAGSPEHARQQAEAMQMVTPAGFCATPVSSHPLCGAHAAGYLNIRWASAQRQGPRTCAAALPAPLRVDRRLHRPPSPERNLPPSRRVAQKHGGPHGALAR